MEKPLEKASVGQQVGWGWVLESPGWAITDSQVDGNSDMTLLARSVQGGLSKGITAPASTFVPPAWALMLDNSVPPCMSLCPSCCCPSTGMSLSRSVSGPFKRNSSSLCLTQSQSSGVFRGRSCGVFSSWHLKPWLGGQVWGWEPSLLRGTSAVKIFLPVYIRHTWMWDQPILRLHPSYQS